MDSDPSDGESAEAAMGLDIILVAAVAENGVIGSDGDIPWHYPEDLRHFKATTMGHPVVMGRRTYESIFARLGCPLPGRESVVLSTRNLELPAGAVLAGGVADALAAARDAAGRMEADTAYVVGGASVYEQFLPVADRLAITEIPERPEGDTYFPELDADEWREVARRESDGLAFVEYERRIEQTESGPPPVR